MTQQQLQPAAVFSWLRAMSGGKLTQAQVEGGDKIIATSGLAVFAQTIGYTLPTAVTGQHDISPAGYALIKQSEGLKLQAYKDSGGIWTIAHGTIKYPNGKPVREGDTCTEAQALEYLKHDCAWVDAALDRYIKVAVTQNQFDALASFVYNVGESGFQGSKMLAKLNAGDFAAAAANFDRWVYVKSTKVQGLVNRRAREKALFLS